MYEERQDVKLGASNAASRAGGSPKFYRSIVSQWKPFVSNFTPNVRCLLEIISQQRAEIPKTASSLLQMGISSLSTTELISAPCASVILGSFIAARTKCRDNKRFSVSHNHSQTRPVLLRAFLIGMDFMKRIFDFALWRHMCDESLSSMCQHVGIRVMDIPRSRRRCLKRKANALMSDHPIKGEATCIVIL